MSKKSDPHELAAQADAVLWASRDLLGITALSVAGVEDVVSIPQLRVLVLVRTRGAMNVATVAAALGVNASNASRACDRLMQANLINRTTSQDDRRTVSLSLTAAGEEIVDQVFRRRRAAIAEVLTAMEPDDRTILAHAMAQFAAAAGEPADTDALTLFWPGQRPSH